MNKDLKPFQPPKSPLNFQTAIHLTASQASSSLKICYSLKGAVESLLLPPMQTKPVAHGPLQGRAHELWKNTCFEWFIGLKNSPQYWEFNLSQQGYWNFYELQSYRSELRESDLCTPTKFKCSTAMEDKSNSTDSSLDVEVDINLNNLLQKYPSLIEEGILAITGVIRWNDGNVSYYSLQHPKDKPDFHHRDGFQIELSNLFNSVLK